MPTRVRVIQATVNTTVFFNNQLPAVAGDQASMAGTARPLVGPYGHDGINWQFWMTGIILESFRIMARAKLDSGR